MARWLGAALGLVAALSALAGQPPALAQGASGGGAWSTVTSLPTPRWGLAAATGADGRIYAIGGEDPATGGMVVGEVDAYSPATNSWAAAAPMPTPRTELAAVAGPDGRIYALGGRNNAAEGGGALRAAEAYSPATGAWSELAPLPVPMVSPGAAVGPDGRVYAFAQRTAAAYTPATGTWAVVATLSPARMRSAAATGAGGRIYVFGVPGVPIIPPWVAAAYAPASNTWGPVADVPAGYSIEAVVAGRDGLLYAIGSRHDYWSDRLTSQLEVYDPKTNAWRVGPRLASGRIEPAGAGGPTAGSTCSVGRARAARSPRWRRTRCPARRPPRPGAASCSASRRCTT